jgi:hypothetical protein
MKNVSTGFGLCVAATAALAYPFVSSLAPNANAVGIGPTAVSAVAAAATAQGAPTIVWYGAAGDGAGFTTLFRAWSDGRVEAKRGFVSCNFSTGVPFWNHSGSTGGAVNCGNEWVVVNNPASGLTFDADLNFDEAVDGVDLGMMLAKWGPAPRNPVPPSDCPLALINP